MTFHLALRSASIAILIAASAAIAQEPAQKPAPAPPAIAAPTSSLGDLSLEIAKLQRDLLLRDAQMKSLSEQFDKLRTERLDFEKTLGVKVGEAGKLCKSGEIFDALKLGCQVPEKPVSPP